MSLADASALVATDYDAVDDRAAIRARLREEYPEMDGTLFERYAERYLSQTYPEDSGDDVEDSVARLKMKRDAEAWRESKRAARAELLDGADGQTTAAPELEPDPAAAMRTFLDGDPVTRSLRDAGALEIAVADDRKVSVSVADVAGAVEMAVDPDKFFALFAGPQGSPDMSRWYEVAAFAADPDAFKRALWLDGKSAANAELARELTNPSSAAPPQTTTATRADSPAAAMLAKYKRELAR